MVPRSELSGLEARSRAQEATAKKDAERHQKALDTLNEKLQTLLEENDSLKSSIQASSSYA